MSTVVIVEAHDIVFTQVTTRLHFDDFECHLAGVREPVLLPHGDIGALVFRQKERVFTARDLIFSSGEGAAG